MKALSIHPEYAMNIIKGLKTVEVRSWTTKYRGDMLICATAKQGKGLISSHALGVVTLEDVVPMQRGHARDAMVSPYEDWKGYYAWILKNPRPIVPFPMKGKLSLWECDHAVEYLPAPTNPHALRSYCETYWNDFLEGRNRNQRKDSPIRTESKEAPSQQTKQTSDKVRRSASDIAGPESEQHKGTVPKHESAQSEVRMDTIKVINNITETLKDDLQATIRKTAGSLSQLHASPCMPLMS